MQMDNRIFLPWTFGYKWLDILGAVICVGTVLLSSTYIITTCRFLIGSLVYERHQGRQPLTVPYWIPFIGSGIVMANDAHKFYESAMKKSRGQIVGARLGPLYSYFIPGAKNVQFIFRNSRSLTSEFLVMEVFKKVIGVPKRDLDIFEADNSGSGAVPYTKVADEQRIWRHLHDVQSRYLQSNDSLNVLTTVFTREFLKVVDAEPVDEWMTTPLYQFFRSKMSTASTITMIGKTVFKHSPNLIDDFWEFFSGFMGLFMGFPRFLQPKAWDARARLTNACTQHLKAIEDRYDSINAIDPDWSEEMGSRVSRIRDKTLKDDGISLQGRGSLLAGFIIGINGNAVPLASWILIELVRTPGLLDAIHEEISTVVNTNTKQYGDISLDLPRLLCLPLLSSVFTETLRLRMSTTPTRQLRNDLEVDGFLLKAGNCVMLPTWLAHTDAEWSTVDHPATTFWAERFLPSGSGSSDFFQPKPGTYFPFGGGSSMCPGRFFAKREILTAVAIMVIKFDIKLVEFVHHNGKPSDRGPEMDVSGAGAGALMPDRDIMVKLRRRL